LRGRGRRRGESPAKFWELRTARHFAWGDLLIIAGSVVLTFFLLGWTSGPTLERADFAGLSSILSLSLGEIALTSGVGTRDDSIESPSALVELRQRVDGSTAKSVCPPALPLPLALPLQLWGSNLQGQPIVDGWSVRLRRNSPIGRMHAAWEEVVAGFDSRLGTVRPICWANGGSKAG
jgi:hypothetical protein